MKLIILGSGTCVPSVKRASPSILLEAGKTKILLDIGAGSIRQLTKVNSNLYKKIDAVYLSHHHTDHTSDLKPLIQALNWTPGFTRRTDLYVLGSLATKKMIQDALKKPVSFKAKFISLKRKSKFKNLTIETIPGCHAETSIVLKVKYKGKSFVYAADSDFDPKISGFAKDCDLLVIENSFPEGKKEIGHLDTKGSAEIAQMARVKKLLLTHFYPPCEKVDIKRQAKKYYKGPVVLAKDFMEIKI